MVWIEAPASGESRRQQQLPTPAATAPLLDSTNAIIASQTFNDGNSPYRQPSWQVFGKYGVPPYRPELHKLPLSASPRVPA